MTGIIVVGVDGSETALRAAHTARDLAASLGATLHVVSAFDSDRTEVYSSGGDKWIVSDAGDAEKVAGASQTACALLHSMSPTRPPAASRPRLSSTKRRAPVPS